MTVAEQLVQAEAAYHQLQIGGAVTVFIDQNGERVNYTVGNKSDLYSYIQRLRAQIANPCADQVMRPLNFIF